MEWTRPAWLWTLTALPILALVAARARRRTARGWKALGRSGVRVREADWRWLVALGLLAIAAAGPRWNWRELPGGTTGQDVVLVIDTSRSMGVADALPNRMGTATTSATSLVRAMGREEGGRVGVVAFAGRGVVRCPLTTNLGVVTDTLQSLRPGDVQPGGTNLASGVGVALDLLAKAEENVPRTIVLFTDGEDHAGSWPALVSRLRKEKVTLHGVAVGDVQAGHPVPAAGGKPLQFQGKVVESRRHDTPIQALAAATGGAFVRLGLAPVDLAVLFERRIKPFAAQRREQLRNAAERADQHVPFVFAAFVLGVSACRPARIRAALMLWPLLVIVPGASPGGESPADWIREGKAAYDRKEFERARASFDRALRAEPRSAVAAFDAAATAFQEGRFDEARGLYERSLRLAKDPGLRMKIHYALGNTLVALGDREGAIASYDRCIASTVAGPSYDAIRRDAAINKRFAQSPTPQASQPESDPGNGREPNADEGTPKGEKPAPDPEGPGGSGETRDGPHSGNDSAAGAEESTQPSSPRERFREALDNARQARDFRPSDGNMPPTSDGVLKDW